MSPPAAARPTLASFWRDLPREGRLLLSVVVFQFLGNGLVLPFWVVYLHEVRGFSLGTAGLLLGLQPLVGLLTVGPAGTVIDRCGARVVLIGSLVSVILAELVMAFAATVPLAALGLSLSGIGFGVSFPASQAMVATIVPSAIRQRYFGANFTLLNLGIGIGGVLGGVLVDVDRLWTFQAIYLIDAVTFLPALALLLWPLRHVAGRPPPDDGADARAPSYAEVLRIPGMRRLIALTFVGSFVAYAQLNAGLPAFARAVGRVSTQTLGFAFAANTVVIVLLQLLVLGRIEGRRRTRVMVVMAAVWAVAWSLMGLSGLAPGTLVAALLIVACAAVFAFGETLLQPTMPAIVNDLATDRVRGRTNAINSAAFQLPMVLGPPVAGWLIGAGLAAAYVALLVVGCVAVAVLSTAWLEPALGPRANGVAGDSAGPPAPGPVVAPSPGPVRPE